MEPGDHPDLARLVGADRRSPSLAVVVAVLAGLTGLALLLLWPRQPLEVDLSELGVSGEVHAAEVVEVTEGSCSFAEDLRCRRVTFRLLEGPTPGSVAQQEFDAEVPSSPRFRPGERVLLTYIPEAEPTLQYQFADRERRPLLTWVAVAFAIAVVALGRWRGLAALGGLAVSVAILVWFVVPAILSGRSPVLVAAVGAVAIGFVALYLAHGVTPLTHVALIGTVAALGLTVALSALVVELARFSGFASEESFYLTFAGEVDVGGLLLAGIVLGALGALDDVTVTQASAVWEVRRANPEMGHGDLFAAGLRVGRDHIASTVNTLLLAYAGAAMPLLLLFALSRQPLGVIANSEVVATEIVRTLVGSIGLVAAVPITTWLAATVAVRQPPPTTGHLEGH